MNCPSFGRVFFGSSWRVPVRNILRVKSEKGEKEIKVGEIHPILFPKMMCQIIELDVSPSTGGKLKHFVQIPSTVAGAITCNEQGISNKMKTFSINEEHLEKCWNALKCGRWTENGVGTMNKSFTYICYNPIFLPE